MSEKWYDELPEDAFITPTDKTYEQALAKMREGLEQGLDFNSASASLHVEDESLKKQILDDMLKVIIAEEHFTKSVPLDKLAKKLNLPVEQLESAKQDMLEDVKNTSIKAFYKGLGSGTA
jgi:hypothetical protein